MPNAAVIIPHFNDVARLHRCLEALMPQMDAGTELVVVDNGSDQDLSPVTTRWPDLRIVTETRKGAAEARNRGVAETTAPRLYFLDCDCVPAADWLEKAHAQGTKADVIGGQVTVFDETPPPRSGAEAFETVFAFDNRRYVAQKGFSVTANLVTTRAVFAATGPFVHGVSEDLDWCRRATGQGFSLTYDDRLAVSHPTRANWPALARKWHRLTEESYGVHRDSGGSRTRWALRALAMPVSALVHLPRIWRSPELADGGEKRRGAATLIRLRLTRMVWMLRQAMRHA